MHDTLTDPGTWPAEAGDSHSLDPSRHPGWRQAAADVGAYLRTRVNAGVVDPYHASFSLLQMMGETRCGAGWPPAGAGSFNTGAYQGKGPAGSFMFEDSTPIEDGSGKNRRFPQEFKKYFTLAQGVDDVLKWGSGESARYSYQEKRALIYCVAMWNAGYYAGFGKTVPDRILGYYTSMVAFQSYLAITSDLPQNVFEASTPTAITVRDLWVQMYGTDKFENRSVFRSELLRSAGKPSPTIPASASPSTAPAPKQADAPVYRPSEAGPPVGNVYYRVAFVNTSLPPVGILSAPVVNGRVPSPTEWSVRK